MYPSISGTEPLDLTSTRVCPQAAREGYKSDLAGLTESVWVWVAVVLYDFVKIAGGIC